MIFNQLTLYVEDVLKSYILNEILLVATSINFYSLWDLIKYSIIRRSHSNNNVDSFWRDEFSAVYVLTEDVKCPLTSLVMMLLQREFLCSLCYPQLNKKTLPKRIIDIHASMFTYYAFNANEYILKYKRESLHIRAKRSLLHLSSFENVL